MRYLSPILGVLLVLSIAFPRQKEKPEDPRIAIWQAKYAEASSRVAVRVDTVRQMVPRYVTQRDTLLRNTHDTVEVLKFIAVADSTIRACTALANDCEAQRHAADTAISLYQRRNKELEKRVELGPRFQSYVEVSRSLVVGELRVAADADLRLFGRVRAFARAEHTFGYPPRSDLLAGVRAYP